jgi:hypothetical protein
MAVGEDAPTILSTRTSICSPLTVTEKETPSGALPVKLETNFEVKVFQNFVVLAHSQ